jgi:hypothetical protein
MSHKRVGSFGIKFVGVSGKEPNVERNERHLEASSTNDMPFLASGKESGAKTGFTGEGPRIDPSQYSLCILKEYPE